MKCSFLAPSVVMSIVIIFFLSSGAQATEYREIKAEEVLKQIENGTDVDLDNCRIVGEINISDITLKTVPTPYFYDGLNENFRVVESNIKIKDSIFDDYVDFSSVLFNNSVDFTGSTFNNNANFAGTKFNDADFGDMNFIGIAYFPSTNFTGDADFAGTKFCDVAYLKGAEFNDGAFFSGTSFSNNTNFAGTTFNNDADFYGAIFESGATFHGMSCNGLCVFTETQFTGDADFTEMKFNNIADFCYANFNDSANFYMTDFNERAELTHLNFKKEANFTWANFKGDADLTQTKFNGPAYFLETRFNDSADFGLPDTSKNIITQGKSGEIFSNYYTNEGRYLDADNIHFNYRKYVQDNEDITSPSKWIDILSLTICGYGLRPQNVLTIGGVIVVVFASIYWLFQGISKIPNVNEITSKKSSISFSDAMLFSIREFTTLGSSDWYPRDNFRIWVTMEGMIGWIMLGLFMATLTNMMIRS